MGSLPLPPRVETQRLALRPWLGEDLDAVRAALEESVDHLLPWIPWATAEKPTAEQVRALLAGWIEQRESGSNFIYAIFDRAEGRLLGGIGLYARVGPGSLEIGYWLRRSASGSGFATEAARALAAAAFALDGVRALEIHTSPENLASRRIPEKLGYRLIETRFGPDGGGRDTLVFGLDRPDDDTADEPEQGVRGSTP